MVPKPLYSRRLRLLEERHPMGCRARQRLRPEKRRRFQNASCKRSPKTAGRPLCNRRGRRISTVMPTASSVLAILRCTERMQLGSDGKLTRTFETQEYKAAVGYVRDLYASGLFHPNTAQISSGPNARSDFAGGKWTICLTGLRPPGAIRASRSNGDQSLRSAHDSAVRARKTASNP